MPLTVVMVNNPNSVCSYVCIVEFGGIFDGVALLVVILVEHPGLEIHVSVKGGLDD